MSKNLKIIWLLGMVLIVAVGLIHVIDAKDSFSDAIYKGWLFYANGLASVIAAYGIFKRQEWGWNFGLMIAIGSLGGYVASRTVGLPLIAPEPDAWFEPIGVVSMTAEAFYVLVFFLNRKNKL